MVSASCHFLCVHLQAHRFAPVMKSIPFYSQFSLERPLVVPDANTACADAPLGHL